MAFILSATIHDYEVRGTEEGTSKKGNAYMSIRVESKDGFSTQISVTDSELFRDVRSLKRGDIISCDVSAVSGKDRSYITLRSVPVVQGNAYDGQGF